MALLPVAIKDLSTTLCQYSIWWHLGYVEVKQRYRRSVLGPWWITISLSIFVAMMGLVFSRLFHQSMKDYLPFFTAGFIFWTFLSTGIVEATEIFRGNAGFIKQINLPYNIYVFKHLVKQLIFMLHNLIVYVVVLLLFQIPLTVHTFLIFPGLLLFLLNLYWICLVTAMVCARFQDIVSIVTSCMQVAFFVTPISWMPRLLNENTKILRFNPFVYLIDVVRSPLLGTAPDPISWVVCTCLAIFGMGLALMIFSSVRSRIAFWVD